MTLLSIFQAILGVAEEIVPVFIHNPNSQKVEGIVVTTAGAVVNSLASQTATANLPGAVPGLQGAPAPTVQP